jgi:CubicO group peptidase (beta-lactamase class C family)
MSGKQVNHMSPGTYGHEGAGVSWSYVDPKEDFIASMFLPYYNGEFNLIPIHRTKYIIWSGLV